MKPGRRRIALLLAAVVSVNASYTVMIPFVPDLEDRAGAGPVVVALTFALFAGAKALAQPVGGWWVDRWRADRVAMLSMLTAAAGIALTALARDSATLLTARVVWGIGEGLVSPALYAGMTALCRQHEIPTSRMMGNFGSAAVAGFLLGPLIAGAAVPVGLTGLFLAGAVITAATAVGLVLAIPGQQAPQPEEEAEPAPAADAPAADAPAAGPAPTRWWVWALLLGGLDMFTFLVYSALEPLLPEYLSSGADSSARTVISAVFVAGLAVSGLAMWLLGRFTLPLRTLAATGLGFTAVGLCAMAATAHFVAVGLSFMVYMFGYATLFLTARRGIVELKAATSDDGKAFGLFGLVSDLGNVLGPLLGVALYAVNHRLPFLLLGAVSGLVLLALAAVARRRTGLPGAAATSGPVAGAKARGADAPAAVPATTAAEPDGR
ncbi:MFS transporter [Streptomyces sp. SID8381]|uniref:MFS transporter n=1 Tax=unclassified Streptomyces TaxID=2593676 RepID=UPI0003657296|nr:MULTISPECIES: MFS transporter [unclassified Streptomyces]MYX30436.1 MFS transporter [Streptomyces sp. SID8381]